MTTMSAPAIVADTDVVASAAPGGTAAGARSGRVVHAGRTLLGWLLLVAAVVALWPAQWGGTLGLTIVSGHSMESTYYTGDLVVTLRQSNYAVGDVVSYVVPDGQLGAGGRVIHRIVEIDGSTLTTRGDNNTDADPWTFAASDITGRAVFQVPGVGLLWGREVYPFIIAAIVGTLVTLLLWPSRPDARATTDTEAHEDAPHA